MKLPAATRVLGGCGLIAAVLTTCAAVDIHIVALGGLVMVIGNVYALWRGNR